MMKNVLHRDKNMLPDAWLDSAQQADNGKMQKATIRLKKYVKSYQIMRQKITIMQTVPGYCTKSWNRPKKRCDIPVIMSCSSQSKTFWNLHFTGKPWWQPWSLLQARRASRNGGD